MALFQPSHIVPSSLSGLGNGVVAASQNVNITWQVNGNSPMTAFGINIYTNEATPSFVYGTGLIDSGFGLPFYGVDSKGNTKTFSYNPGVTWGSLGIEDGKDYKLNITQFWNGMANYVTQYSESAFIARSLPALVIESLPSIISTVSHQFSALYSQAQGDSINWVRWELSVAQNGSYEVVDDTGEINTALLQYEYDGFMTGSTYAVKATVETKSGVIATTGWQEFIVQYTEKEASGAINLQYDGDNECALLSWQKASDIPATTIQGVYQSPLGGMYIQEGGQILWDTVDGNPMAFSAPYSAYWRGLMKTPAELYDTLSDHVQSNAVSRSVFSNDGNKLYLGDKNGRITVYQKNANGRFDYQSTFAGFLWSVSAMAISNDDEKLVVCFKRTLSGGDEQGLVIVFDTATLSRVDSISFALGAVYTATYCGDNLFLGGSFLEKGILYAEDAEENYSKIAELSVDGNVFASSYNNGILYLGGSFSGYAAAYSIDLSDGAQFVKDADIYMNAGVPFDGEVRSIRLNSQASNACIVGSFSGKAIVYSVSGSTLTFASGFEDLEGSPIDSAWNDDATKIVLVGDFDSAGAKLFDFSGNDVKFILNLSAATEGATPIQGSCETANFSPDGKTLVVGGGNQGEARIYQMSFPSFEAVSFGDDLSISFANGFLSFDANGTLLDIPITNDSSLYYAIVGFLPGALAIYWLNSQNQLISSLLRPLLYTQPVIPKVLLRGEQINQFVYIANTLVTFESNYFVERGYETLFLPDYSTATYQAGIVDAISTRNALYRSSSDGEFLFPVYKFPATINRIKDFSVKSNQRYLWEMFFVTARDEYSTPITTSTFCKQFRYFTLIEATEDPEYPNVYHALNVWRFGSNVSNWSVSNNNTPGILQNFTKYPRRQPSTQAYKSGVLQCLLSNTKDGKYRDNSKQMELLFAISESNNTFFLRDVKGNMYMVHTNGPITQSMSTKSYFNEVTISLPWMEVGDASNVSIIQTPEDEGWENNMVALAEMDLNAETSLLSVSYPNPYVGTLFGSNGTHLTAITPSTMEQPALEIENGDLYATT